MEIIYVEYYYTFVEVFFSEFAVEIYDEHAIALVAAVKTKVYRRNK